MVKPGEIGDIAGTEITAILNAIYPRSLIIDGSFPKRTFSWLFENVIGFFEEETDRPATEREFLQRFRQCGGHMPLLSSHSLSSHLNRHLSEVHKLNEPRIFVCGDRCQLNILNQRANLDCDLIILFDSQKSLQNHSAALKQMGYQPWLSFKFVRPKGAENLQLLVREVPGPDILNRVVATAQTFAVNIRVTPHGKKQRGSLITITLPEKGFRPGNASMPANRLVHDGSRRSEGNASYSWLWVGAERHIRILLGRVPHQFRTVRVIVPNAFSTTNLQSAKLLLNGTVLPTHVEIWDEGVGAVSAELPLDPAPYHVLGFSVPLVKSLDDGSAELAACIDRIELRS